MDDSRDHITERGLRESSARLFPACSVMLTSHATIGAIAINTHEACTNQGFITCLPNERVPLNFLFHWLTENVPKFVRMASGATFKEISRGVFKTIEFLQPPAKLVRRLRKPPRRCRASAHAPASNPKPPPDARSAAARLLSGQVKLENAHRMNHAVALSVICPVSPAGKMVDFSKSTNMFRPQILSARLTEVWRKYLISNEFLFE